jgi:DNA polymerase-4
VSQAARPTILHADLDAFYASVEQRDDLALRGRPVIVGGGVVLASSYEARACGVRTAMGGARARALCPEAVVVAPRFDAYVQASRAVSEIFRRTSPLVESLSIDEAFLDVRGLQHISGSALAIAARLRREVRDEVGLAITVGLASTKFLAKVASGVAKPDGLLMVLAGGERAFLDPLPVGRLWGVGQVSAGRLHAAGIDTVAEIARLPERALIDLLGRSAGRRVHALALNHDPRPVRSGVRRRSIGAQRALGRRQPGAAVDRARLRADLTALVDRVARRLRAADRVCRTVVLRLRFDDYTRATRSRTVAEATARTSTLEAVASRLLDGCDGLITHRGLTLIGVALTNLGDARAVQLALPFDRAAGLDRTLDAVHARFGSAAVRRGTLVGRPADEWISLGE